jgi:hypothetical protein
MGAVYIADTTGTDGAGGTFALRPDPTFEVELTALKKLTLRIQM